MSGMGLPGEKSQNNAKICCKIVSLDVSGRAGGFIPWYVCLARFVHRYRCLAGTATRSDLRSRLVSLRFGNRLLWQPRVRPWRMGQQEVLALSSCAVCNLARAQGELDARLVMLWRALDKRTANGWAACARTDRA
jgi:hypothetical protein